MGSSQRNSDVNAEAKSIGVFEASMEKLKYFPMEISMESESNSKDNSEKHSKGNSEGNSNENS